MPPTTHDAESLSCNPETRAHSGSLANVQLTAAMLADCAQTRDGTLFVLGGGFGRLIMTRFPTNFGRQVVLLLEFHPSEAGRDFEITTELANADGAVIQRVVSSIRPERPESLEAGEVIVAPMVVGLVDAVIPAPGRYGVDIFINGEHRQSLGFVVLQRPV